MKFLPLTALLFFLAACNSQEAQEDNQPAAPITIQHDSGTKKEISNPYAPTDISPVDIAYFPADYPVRRMQQQSTDLPIALAMSSSSSISAQPGPLPSIVSVPGHST